MDTKRELWYDGPNYAADAVVLSSDSILLIKRGDTGTWALPGGFVEPDESSLDTSRREALEVAGIDLPFPIARVYSGKVDSRRNSPSAWIETDAYMYEVPETRDVLGNDDAQDAAWFNLDNLEQLQPEHQPIVERALIYRDNPDIEDVFKQPPELLRQEVVRSGHMAYDHLLLSDAANHRLFAKIHDASKFSDTLREEHSRHYLIKEQAMFDHLRVSAYPHVPSRSKLFEDKALIMEAMHPDDGWHWRAPHERAEAYIDACLQAFENLESIALPPETGLVNPTLMSIRAEGWDTMDGKVMEQIRKRLADFTSRLHQGSQAISKELSLGLHELKTRYASLPAPMAHVLTHHDARQSNIAWHPARGVKIVDWSWSGAGRPKSDRTALLIDLHKSGHNVLPYLKEHFNKAYAVEMIGFWLVHSTWKTRDEDDTVRFQQALSAIAAYDLLRY